MDNSKLPKSLFEHSLFESGQNTIWPATLFKLRRNLGHHLFPNKMTKARLENSLDLITKALLQLPEFKEGQFVGAHLLSPCEKNYLLEHCLLSNEIDETRLGQGFILNPANLDLAYINFKDHLCLQWIDSSCDWTQTFNKIESVDSQLSEKLDLAYSETFGFLTADPSLCGTALTIQAFLHLPLLIHQEKLSSLIEDLDDEVLISSISASSDYTGDIVVVQNKFTLGVSEDRILELTHKAATQLQSEESKLREKMKKSGDPHLKDQIARAFGLLNHSYEVHTREALNALSLLLLGADLGWVENLTPSAIYALFFQCRKAHLALSHSEELSKEELAQMRSRFFHDNLKEKKLNL